MRTMATKFSPCKGSYVLNQFPSNVMFGMNGFHLSASGAIQGHHGPLVKLTVYLTMPILGSSNSAANKDMMAKIWTNGNTIICLSNITMWAWFPFT